jgi:hypothetical protein
MQTAVVQIEFLFFIWMSMLALKSNSFHFKFSNHPISPTRTKTTTVLNIGRLDSIPTDLSATDSITSAISTNADLLLPDTTITALDGGTNLGALLWGFSLYLGLFPDQRSPADWVLVLLGNLTISSDSQDENNNQWYREFVDGYQYEPPPPLFFARIGVFAGLGYLANNFWIQQFDGDVFWGWSTGFCLSLPAGLLALSKDRLLSRSESAQQNELKEQFKEFRQRRLERVPGKRTSEELVLQALQRISTFRSLTTNVAEKEKEEVYTYMELYHHYLIYIIIYNT